MFDILSVVIKDFPDETYSLDIIENETVDFRHSLVRFSIFVKNTGATGAEVAVLMYVNGKYEEEIADWIEPGQIGGVGLHKSGYGYIIGHFPTNFLVETIAL